MGWRRSLQNAIRPSTTRSTAVLWAKSLLNAVLFFATFMVALPWLANWLLPAALPFPAFVHFWLAGPLLIVGIALWTVCLDVFSRRGRGTPFPADAPRELVTTGPFAVVRNPLMLGELMVIWAEALFVGSVGVGVYALAITIAAHLAAVNVEEPELRRRFGAAYDEYCRNVPRWFPKLGDDTRRSDT